MVNILGATGSLLPVLLSSKTLADKPPVAPIGTCSVQCFPLRAVDAAAQRRLSSHARGAAVEAPVPRSVVCRFGVAVLVRGVRLGLERVLAQ